MVNLCNEVAKVFQFILHCTHQLGEVLPLHLLALSMEVKPDVVEIVVLQVLVKFGEGFSYSVL